MTGRIKSEFSRNVLALMTGTTIAQAIPIAISPILTRLYSPEDFGLFALFIAVSSIIASVSNASYEQAIVLPKKNIDAINIFALGFIINIFITIISLTFIIISHDLIVEFLRNKEISIWLYAVPFVVFLTGTFNLLIFFNNRLKNYKDMARASIYKSIVNAIVQLIFVFFKSGVFGLISGRIFSQIVSNTKLFFNIKKMGLFKYIKPKKMLYMARRYRKFPLLTLPNVLADSFREHGFNVFVNVVYSAATLGQFYLAQRMLKSPFAIIGGSISKVFLQKISVVSKEELFDLSFKYIKKSSLLSAPIFIGIYFFSTDIFIFFFGERWILSGKIASSLSPWLFLSFITSPLSNIFIVLEKQEVVLVYAIIYMLLPIAAVLAIGGNFMHMINTLSFLMSAILIIFIIQIFYTLKKERRASDI